jgi:hypothetical protein
MVVLGMEIELYIPYSNGGFYYQPNEGSSFEYSKDVELVNGVSTISFSSNGILSNVKDINDASDLIKLYGISKPEIYNRERSFIRTFNKIHNKIESYKKTFTGFGVNLNDLQIEHCIPEKLLQEFLSCRTDFLKLFIDYCDDIDLSYYNNFFKKSKYAVSNLQQMSFNKDKLSYALLLNKGVKAATKNLTLLGGSNISSPLKMNMFGTRTGRLSVERGINILILPKNYRNVIQSKFSDGQVYILDFNAMEMRTAAHLIGNKDVLGIDDLHCHFAEKVFGSANKRDLFKKMFFPLFFGASVNKIAGTCDITLDEANNAIKTTKKVFPFDKVIDLVTVTESNGSKCMSNCFGRPIFLDKDLTTESHKLVNYYIQSSAADLALQSLYQVVKYTKENRLKSGPIYIHHDAIAIDVHPNEVEHVHVIKDIMENKNLFNIKFPVSVDILK